MALAAMPRDREPEVARFIDTYKYDQDMNVKRDRFGGGTSLPLNSDGYEDKQKVLRDERHKDWLVQQDKGTERPYTIAKHIAPVPYAPQNAADYDAEIQKMTDRYHNQYNEQRQTEQQKMEARRHAPPPRPAQPPGPQMDYNLAGEQARAEERRAYQDYMGKYNSEYIASKPPLDYEENRKLLQAERRKEYNHMMEEKAKEERYWAMRGRPVTPPGGLNIGNYDRQVKEQAQAKKQEYKKMLDEQQKEHMFLRARQEPEMAVLDRHGQPSQYLADKPPAGPSYGRGRDEAEKKRHEDEMFRQQQQQSKPAEVVKNPFYSSDDYEKFQKELQRKQGEEYREFLSQGEEQRRHSRDGNSAPKTTYGSSFNRQPASPNRIHQQTPPSRTRSREHRSDQMTDVLTFKGPEERVTHGRDPSGHNGYSRHEQWNNPPPDRDYRKQNGYSANVNEPTGSGEHRSDQMNDVVTHGRDPHGQNGYSRQEQWNKPPPVTAYEEHNGYSSNTSEPGDYKPKLPDYLTANPNTFHQQMTAPYPKAYSAPLEPGSSPATPSKLSLPVGQYDELRPFIVKQRNKEYNSLKDKLPSIKKIGVTPEATGISLPVGQYDKARPLLEKQRNVEYNKLIDTGRIGKKSLREKISTPPNLQGLPIGQQNYERMYRAMEHERNREYNEFLQQKYGGNKTIRTTRSEPNRTDHPKSSFYYGNELEQAEKKRMLDEERRNEYHQYMKEHNHPRSTSIEIPSDVDSGLPIGQQHHEAMRKFLSDQRNKEYNQLVDRKKNEVQNRSWNFDQNGVLELHGDDAVQSRQRELRAERKQDYNAYISQQKVTNPGRRHDFVDSTNGPYDGLFHGLGEHGNRSDDLNRERQKDYNDRLEQKYAGKDRPSGRPKWVQESLPNDTDRGRSPMKTQPPVDQYQQMLNEKRREEANLRRFEDPEYQERLSRGRDRGEAGQRYGY